MKILLISLLVFAGSGRSMIAPKASPFEDVKEFFGVGSGPLQRRETVLLIRNILYRVKCDHMDVNCADCLSFQQVMSYLGRSREKSLDEISFRKLSEILLVFMKDVKRECSAIEESIVDKKLSHSSRFSKITGARQTMDLATLVETLEAINKNYRFGTLVLDEKGLIVDDESEVVDFDTDFRCFNPKSLYADLGKPMGFTLDHSSTERLAGFIVSNVLRGRCIRVDDKPSPYSFMDELMTKMGNRSRAMLDHEEFENLLEALNIGRRFQDEADQSPLPSNRQSEQSVNDNQSAILAQQLERLANSSLGPCLIQNCYTSEDIRKISEANISAIFGSVETIDECPDLLTAILKPSSLGGLGVYETPATLSMAYGYGAIATGVISLAPLLGAIFPAILALRAKGHILCFLMALAVSSLTGDAMMHLIRQAMDLGEPEGGILDGLPLSDSLLKMASVLASVYVFVVVQMSINLIGRKKDCDVSSGGENPVPQTGTKLSDMKKNDQALVGMVILGDAAHNFVDGLAIGAAFVGGVSGGLSTSIAVLCHELPHELGDMATLLSAGLTMRKVLLMGLVSGVTAFAGLLVGVPLAANTSGKEWVFAATAGIFIYVSLANIIPELIVNLRASSHGWLTFVFVNIGLLMGYITMFLIAAFEEHIRIG